MNKHIEENLKHYISMKNPEYAVLLSGKWGSGKTYFMNNFVKSYRDTEKIKFINVSLFGLSDTSSIDEDIFQQLHPLLSNKCTKFVGNLAKSAVKFGLKYDYDGDKKTDGTIGINLQSFNPLSLFSDTKEPNEKLIFVFDDLERTSIKLSEILGYINYLVEQSEFKVIILANENEIIDKDNFNKFKEKIIGKTFEVKQDLDATFDTFINIVENSKDTLIKHKQLIKDIFITGKHNNLRHIRQTVLYFEYFYTQLENKFQKHDEVMQCLINEFFIFSIEIKSGILNSENFKSLDYLNYSKEDTKNKETDIKKVLDKYSLQNILDINIWKNILLDGYIKQEEIADTLGGSKFFIDEKTESWRKLWHFQYLEDVEFKEYLEEVSNKFYNNDYKEQGKLLHVIALLLYFSKSKMYNETQKNIMKKAKENIKNCIVSENWDTIKYKTSFGGSAYGLGFFNREAQNMQDMMTYFKKEIEKYFSIKLKDKAKLLLDDFNNNNLENVEKKLQQEFYEIPIFSKMDINNFVDMVQHLKHKNLYDITQVIKRRYESNYYLEKILLEEKFWKSVNSKMLQGINVNDNPVKYNLLKSFKNYTVKDILQKFQKEKERLDTAKLQNNDN